MLHPTLPKTTKLVLSREKSLSERRHVVKIALFWIYLSLKSAPIIIKADVLPLFPHSHSSISLKTYKNCMWRPWNIPERRRKKTKLVTHFSHMVAVSLQTTSNSSSISPSHSYQTTPSLINPKNFAKGKEATTNHPTLSIALVPTTVVVINVRFAWNYIFLFNSLSSYLTYAFGLARKHTDCMLLSSKSMIDSVNTEYLSMCVCWIHTVCLSSVGLEHKRNRCLSSGGII